MIKATFVLLYAAIGSVPDTYVNGVYDETFSTVHQCEEWMDTISEVLSIEMEGVVYDFSYSCGEE